MDIEPGIFRDIAKNIAEDNCVLFLGAGASIGTGEEEGAPSSEKLKNFLVEDLRCNYNYPSPDDLNKLSLDKVAECYEIKAGRINLLKMIVDQLRELKKPLKIHELIVKFPFKIIITANYDDLLEKQFEQDDKNYCCIYYQDENLTNCFNAWDYKTTLILKLHGCIRKRDFPLIISTRDYTKFLAKSSLVKSVLEYLVDHKVFLFMGYSLSDLNVRSVLFKFWKRTKPYNYSIQAEPVDKWNFTFWREQGISIFQADAVEFFEELLKHFTTDNLKKGLSFKFNPYIENFRMQTYDILEQKITLEFINDLKEKKVNTIDYEFNDEIIDIFIRSKNQKKLIPLIKNQDVEILEQISNLLKAESLYLDFEVLEAMINIFKETAEDGIKWTLLDFFYNKLSNEQLNSLKQPVIDFAISKTNIKTEIEFSEKIPFEPEKLDVRILCEKLLNWMEVDQT